MVFNRSLLAGALLLLCAGCATPAKQPASDAKTPEKAVLTAPPNVEAEALANACQKALWSAFQTGDAALLLPFLPPDSRPRAEAMLRQKTLLEKQFGKTESIRFGCEVVKPLVRDYYWLIRCVKTVPPSQEAQVTELFLLVRIGCQDGKCVVAGFGIRP